jgi:Recombination, repair and ssDNA binding protein UvsY
LKLEDIFELWSEYAVIDKTALDDEALKIPKAHNKFYRLYSAERLRVRQQKSDLNKLLLEKYTFYTEGPTKEQVDAGWKLPPRGKIIKNEVEKYLEADQDIIDLNLRIAYTQEKVDALKSIIDELNRRSFNIRAAIDFIKFTQGVG